MPKDNASKIPTSSSRTSQNDLVLPGITRQTKKLIQPNGTEHEITVLQTKNQHIGPIVQFLSHEKVTSTDGNLYISKFSIRNFTRKSNLVTSKKIQQHFSTPTPQNRSQTQQRTQFSQEQQAKIVVTTANRHFIQMAVDATELKKGEFLKKRYGEIIFSIFRPDDNSYEISTLGKILGKGAFKTAYISVPIIKNQPVQVEYGIENSRHDQETIREQEELEFNNYNAIHEKLLAKDDPNLNLLLSLKKYTSVDTKKSKIVSEKCDGDLSQIKEILPYIEKVALAIQGAKVLTSVHAAGYVHLDIKPANFLVKTNNETGTKEIRLCDFAFVGRAHRKGEVRGTLNFLAPELIGAFNPIMTPAMDVFSYGATLYDLFPLQNDTDRLVTWRALKNQTNERVNIRQKQKELRASPDPIHHLIADCIDVNPQKRPTMKQVEKALEKISKSSEAPPNKKKRRRSHLEK